MQPFNPLVNVSMGPKSSLRGRRSKYAQRAKRPSPRLGIGESRRPPPSPPGAGGAAQSAAPPAPGPAEGGLRLSPIPS
eukprot:15461623-Alexandrium_andersonii.AAC.1